MNMNMNMNASIIRLTYVFLGLFLVVSLVMVNIQIFRAQDLQASSYNPRLCMSDSQPLRGSIYDRNGIKLVWSVADPKAPCGYRRAWNPDAVKAGLGPVIGYYSNRYGASGIEATYNDILNGVHAASIGDVENKLLHRRVVGSDLYLTIDLNLQEQANALYNLHAIEGGVCQTPGSDPAGSITVEDPQTGEILAMVSRPYYDPSRVDDPTYWDQLIHSPNSPLLNRAAQGLYTPGSTFKTVTLSAALDTGQFHLNDPFTLDNDSPSNIDQDAGKGGDRDNDQDQDQALYFTVPSGETITWDDYFPTASSGGWVGIASPVTLQDGYAYSDNVIYARVAYQLGADGWLSYLRKFGISTPGTAVDAVPFDGAFAQSRAYPPGANFDGNLLAESGFGQGDLQISPLTMTEVTSALAANGQLFVPHVVYKDVPAGQTAQGTSPVASTLYSGAAVVSPDTAATMRQAMRSVVTYGTAYHTSTALASSQALEGGKTGTAQLANGQAPHAWWISMAPAVNDVNSPGTLVVVVMKENSGEGACQINVADDVYRCAAYDHDWTPPGGADIGSCPLSKP